MVVRGGRRIAGPGLSAGPWADRSFLREVQYRTDVNLAARQSIYRYQQPPVDLVGRVLDLALEAVGPDAEVIADVGCGNGVYLAELARRGTARHLVGADLSPGMLRAARQRTHRAGRIAPVLLAAYVRSMPMTAQLADSDALIRAVTSRLSGGSGAPFLDTIHSGCLICA